MSGLSSPSGPAWIWKWKQEKDNIMHRSEKRSRLKFAFIFTNCIVYRWQFFSSRWRFPKKCRNNGKKASPPMIFAASFSMQVSRYNYSHFTGRARRTRLDAFNSFAGKSERVREREPLARPKLCNKGTRSRFSARHCHWHNK